MPAKIRPVKLKLRLDSSLEGGGGWHTVTVSGDIGRKFPSDGRSRRVVCTINNSESIQAALMPFAGDFFIMINKGVRSRLGVVPGDVLDIRLETDTSKYGFPMPEEFEEVLRQDDEGDKLFHALTPGKQRSLIYTVSSAKDIDRRIHTAITILEHLKDNDGKVDNKKLQSDLKRPML